jgi:CCR4-NOT transcriptional complex subunit CAF120
MISRQKRQEELARETGASLINVPNKPPPPETGFLGAITVHEREYKREGSIGAALTEREHEKRLAEEQQHKLDKLQCEPRQFSRLGYDWRRPKSKRFVREFTLPLE